MHEQTVRGAVRPTDTEQSRPVTAADRLSARLDELASSVHRAGVSADASARLLELAALATMKALELDLCIAARNLRPHGETATSDCGL